MSCERIITVCTFVRLVCGDGQCNMMLGKQTPAGRQHSFSSAQVCNMAVLEKLGLLQFNENLGTNTLYEHMLDTIKVKKYTQAILTDGFVTELHGLLCLTRSRHEKVPKNKLSRAQFLHVIGYLVATVWEGCHKILRLIWSKKWMFAFETLPFGRWLWSYWPVHARGVRACTHGTELTVWEGCHKTNMVQKMAVRF